jgi:F5/8 type C domain/Domain of unknown function (DUF1735)
MTAALSVVFACNKKNTPAFATGAIYIREAASSDTLSYSIPYAKDTLITMEFSAAVSGHPLPGLHHVVFGVDTTKIADYRALHGNAILLPSANYFVDWNDCEIAPDSTLSEPAQINLLNASQLDASTTYVLPVVIDNVDGLTGIAQPGQVLYLQVRTGASLYLSKTGWNIVSFSSELLPTYGPANLLDSNNTTDWFTSGVPQNVVIDMGQSNTFSKITFTDDPTYVGLGGYPTQIDIQVSTDGVAWTDKGTFTGTGTTSPQLLDIGRSTARYFNFIIQKSVLFAGISPAIIIGDIGAMQ